MKLHYYQGKEDNFGDALNRVLWPRLLPGVWEDKSDHVFLGIGTLLAPGLPPGKTWTVFGSGAGYGTPPEGLKTDAWKIWCVRGPLTARVLNLDPALAVTDAAMLMALLPEYRPVPAAQRSGIVFMPHHAVAKVGRLPEACARAGITYLDPTDDCEALAQTLRHAELVIADAMHAAIVADVLRVPWVPVMTSSEINTFKWMDWALSMQVPYEPVRLPYSTQLEGVRDALLPLVAGRFATRPGDEAAALASFRFHSAIRSRPGWPVARNLGAAVYKRLARPVVASSVVRGAQRGADERRVDAVASALRRIASGRSYLSSDTVFEARKATMAGLLAELAATARAAA